MIVRISLGMLVYVFISLFFGRTFDLLMLGLSAFFILLPLADWIPYLIIRRRYKLVSHYLWYYPLMYVPLGVVALWIISKNEYYVALFVANSLANFIHATFRTPAGLQWLAPFSWISISMFENKLKIFSKKEREKYLSDVYKKYKERSLKQELGEMRSVSQEFSDRRHPRGTKTIVLLIISILVNIVFWFMS